MNANNSYPRVLIIGETFRYTGGGGITLINLFKDWTSESLAVVTEKIEETTSETNCQKFYRLGHLEIKFPFPFNFINKIGISGQIVVQESIDHKVVNKHVNRESRSTIKYEIEMAYYRLLVYLGICNSEYRLVISDQLLKWIKEFSPDIIYAQPFRYRDMVFAIELKEKTGIPLAIHIMDDSVSFSNKPNLFYLYWKKKINNTFKRMIEIADVHLSISTSMSDEYLKRYNKLFIPFRNPINVNTWKKYSKRDWSLKSEINIIYTGRLAVPNINALLTFCKVVEMFKNYTFPVKLHIYSIDKNIKFASKVSDFKSIYIHEAVPSSEIPSLVTKFDFALLPIDFTKKGILYAKHSISTKTSEYMISGVPIVLFAPAQVALVRYALENKCMYTVSEKDTNKLYDSLNILFNDEHLRSTLAQNAIETAKSDSDALVVRKKIREVLSFS